MNIMETVCSILSPCKALVVAIFGALCAFFCIKGMDEVKKNRVLVCNFGMRWFFFIKGKIEVGLYR